MAGKKDDVEVIGAFPPPELGSSVKKIPFWKKPAFVKGAAAGVLLGGIVIFFVHFKKNSIPHTPSVVSAPPLPENAGGVSKNPEYRRKIAQLNRERTLNASRNGQSVVPTLGGDDKAGEISAGEAKTSSSPDVSPRRDSRKSRKQRVKLRAYEASRTAEVASVDKEISGILATWSGAGDGLAVLSPPKSSIRSGREISSGVKRTSEAAGLPKKKIPVIPAGKILYGRIVNELNSDHPGPVLAQAVGGKWDGVKFLGSFQRDHGALVIKFDRVLSGRRNRFDRSLCRLSGNTTSLGARNRRESSLSLSVRSSSGIRFSGRIRRIGDVFELDVVSVNLWNPGHRIQRNDASAAVGNGIGAGGDDAFGKCHECLQSSHDGQGGGEYARRSPDRGGNRSEASKGVFAHRTEFGEARSRERAGPVDGAPARIPGDAHDGRLSGIWWRLRHAHDADDAVKG